MSTRDLEYDAPALPLLILRPFYPICKTLPSMLGASQPGKLLPKGVVAAMGEELVMWLPLDKGHGIDQQKRGGPGLLDAPEDADLRRVSGDDNLLSGKRLSICVEHYLRL